MKTKDSEQFFGGQNCDKRETTIPSGETTSSDSINQSEESQTSAHNKETMAQVEISANASQVEAEAQLATGQSYTNDQSDKSFVDDMLSRIKDPSTIKTKHLVSYRDAEKEGLKPAFLDFNRNVNVNHVQKLIKSLVNTDTFTNACYVVPAPPILEMFPNITVYDEAENEITLDTPDIDRYYVVFDGQHRIMACMLANKNVMLEFNDFDGVDPLQRIKEINTTQKGWGGEDYRNSNIKANIGDVELYEKSKELQMLHGVSSATGDSYLTFGPPPKLKDLVDGKKTAKYVEENAKRGIGILNAVMTASKGAKELKKMEFLKAIIGAYNETPDSEKPNFGQRMKCYLYEMLNKNADSIKELIASKNFGDLNTKISNGYKSFSKAKSDKELNEMEKEVDENIEKYLDELKKANDKKAANKPLKSGRVDEILKKKKDIEEQRQKDNIAKAKDNVAKAKADSDRAFKKAKETQDHLDSLLGNISAKPVEDDEKK